LPSGPAVLKTPRSELRPVEPVASRSFSSLTPQ
jgi:hypothetical protein